MKKKDRISVLYDYQVLAFQKRGGISRYFYELYRNFTGKYEDELQVKISAYFSCNYYFEDVLKRADIVPKYIGKWINMLVVLKDIYEGAICGKQYDVIHPTYYFPEYLKYIPKFIREKSKLIITVYDLIHELYYPVSEETRKRELIMQAADGIIAISENTKQDILRIYPTVSADKIEVIHLGNSMKVPKCRSNVRFPEKYILMVGNRGEYKNGRILYKAFSLVREEIEDVCLLCIGGGDFDEEEKGMLRSLQIDNVTFQMSLSDEELYYAYKNALCFVFPSMYEGFGLPIIEAFFCQCPVILSNASCFPEIAQDAALYFEPKDYEGLAKKIVHLINDRLLSEQLIQRANMRLEDFSWDKTVEKTYKFYQRIVLEEDER